MTLQELTKNILFKEVIESEDVTKNCTPPFPNDLNKLLIIDDINLQFIKELVRPSELTDRGYITTQNINVVLQPMAIHLIYLINPNNDNIGRIIKDFSKTPCPFLSVHIFASKPISETCLNSIKKCQPLVSKLLTLKELPFSFVVEDSNIFTLGSGLSIPSIYPPSKSKSGEIAERLFSLLKVTNDWPSIRYMSGADIAESVSKDLNGMLRDFGMKNKNFGIENGNKKPCQILILERNFDPKTPFIHDLTVEPITRDLLEVKDNVVEFNVSSKEVFKVHLNDPDPIWQEVRYMHLADAMKDISIKIKELSQINNLPMPEGKISLNIIRKIMTKYPKHSALFKRYQGLTILSQNCMDIFQNNNIQELVELEQDFATNSNDKGEPVISNPAVYVNLLDDIKSLDDRFRLIALYALKSGSGVPSITFDKLVEIGKIDFAKKSLSALETLNFPIIENSEKKRPKLLPPPKEDEAVSCGYVVSRYIPVFWAVLKDMANQNLDETLFPFMGEKNTILTPKVGEGDKSFGFGKYNKKKSDGTKKTKPRFYVFVIGGFCYSEFRLLNAFEKKYSEIDACVGGTELLTPKVFINYLKNM